MHNMCIYNVYIHMCWGIPEAVPSFLHYTCRGIPKAVPSSILVYCLASRGAICYSKWPRGLLGHCYSKLPRGLLGPLLCSYNIIANSLACARARHIRGRIVNTQVELKRV